MSILEESAIVFFINNVCNLSNANSIHTIGIGINETLRKNAVEVMRDGSTYIYDIGGYNGTNPGSANTL